MPVEYTSWRLGLVANAVEHDGVDAQIAIDAAGREPSLVKATRIWLSGTAVGCVVGERDELPGRVVAADVVERGHGLAADDAAASALRPVRAGGADLNRRAPRAPYCK